MYFKKWKRFCKHSIMDDSAIMCDKVIESYDKETKSIPSNFNEEKQLVKRKTSIFYLHFY